AQGAGNAMRVLTVVTEAPPIRSGVALTVEQLAGRLEARGHEVDVISSADVGRVSFGEVRLTGLTRHWREIRRRVLAADVVNLHGPAPSFSDAFLALWRTIPRRLRPQLVYTHHCEIDLPAAGLLCRAYERAHWRLARAACLWFPTGCPRRTSRGCQRGRASPSPSSGSSARTRAPTCCCARWPSFPTSTWTSSAAGTRRRPCAPSGRGSAPATCAGWVAPATSSAIVRWRARTSSACRR